MSDERTKKPRRGTSGTVRARAIFIDEFRKTANVTEAAELAGIDRRTAYKWRDRYPAFAIEWDAAEQQAVDRIEREALRRAVEGFDEPVFQGGKEVGRIRKYSDRLLEILLKGHRPKFIERRVLVGDPNAPLEINATITDEERSARIAALLERGRTRGAGLPDGGAAATDADMDAAAGPADASPGVEG